jgi:glycosyltransferase involved in cell wall biosynthesis
MRINKSNGKLMSLGVVIPCFNESKTISVLLTKVAEQKCVKEIIVVDDASTDDSYQKILEFRDSRIRIIRQPKNMGKGAALQKGFSQASTEVVIVQDADLEYDPNEYLKMLLLISNGTADVVYGSRFLTSESRRAVYFWHRVGNFVLTLFSNMWTNINLTDMETCFKMMPTNIAKELKIKETRFGVEPEITAKLAKRKLRIYEVPISYYGRTYEEGKKITWKDGFRAIYCVVKYNLR